MFDYAKVSEIVREELAGGGFQTNACILAARVTTVALRELGERRVEAIAAELQAYSPAYVAMAAATRKLDRALSAAEAQPFLDAGAWMVHMDFEAARPDQLNRRYDENGYLGHVVVLVRRAWMLDPTLGQVNRPQKHLLVDEPYAWPIDYRQALTDGLKTVSENGTRVHYRMMPGRRDFVTTPDWRLGPLDAPGLVRRVVARIRGEAR